MLDGARRPDVAVVAESRSELDAVGVLAELRRRAPHLPVLVLATETAGDHSRYRWLGAHDVLEPNGLDDRQLVRGLLAARDVSRLEKQWVDTDRLLAASPDAIVVARPDGLVEYTNRAAEKLFGRSSSELRGEQLGFCVVDGSAAPVEILRGAETRLGELRTTDLDWHGRPAVVASIRDVTERLEVEERLRTAKQMEAVGRLAGSLAHDFNNILMVVRSATDTVKSRHGGDPVLAPLLDQMSTAVENGAALTRQLLDLSRPEPPNREAVDLGALVEDMVPLLRGALGPDIALSTEIDRALPPVHGDPAQFRQVVLNLTFNARDAMLNGGRLSIAAETCPAHSVPRTGSGDVGTFVRLTVRDTGQGMSHRTAAQLFEPFFTTKAQGHGTGLGLTTVWTTITSVGGTIEVDSTEGLGTTVTVFLPAAAR